VSEGYFESSWSESAAEQAVKDKPRNDAIQKLTKAIMGQGTSEKYWSTGSGLSKDSAAQMMAEKMYDQGGITDLKQFGKVPVYQDAIPVAWSLNGQPVMNNPGRGYYVTGTVQNGTDENGDPFYPPKYLSADENSKVQPTRYGYYGVDEEGSRVVVEAPATQVKNINGALKVDTLQTTYGNKVTGQAIPMEYSRAHPNDWGGTFAGDSSSGFGVQFQPDGTPIFYTHYDTEDQLGGLGTIISVLAIIPSPIQPFAMAANAVIAAEKGDIVGAIAGVAGAGGFSDVAAAANFANAVKNEDLIGMVTAGSNLAGVSTSSITQSIGESLGATSLVGAKALGGAVLAGAGAAVRGQDAITAAITGAAAGAFSGMKDDKIISNAASVDFTGGLTADDLITDSFVTTGNTSFTDELTSRGLVGDSDVIATLSDGIANLSINFDSNLVLDTFINQAVGSGLITVAPDSSFVGPVQNVDVTDFTNSIASYDITNTLNSDFKPDYSLSSGISSTSLEGLKTTPITDAGSTVGESAVDYSITDGTVATDYGLKTSTSPNIKTMGGGQGITVATSEGELSQSGVTTTGTASNLGDPNSFINKPAPDGTETTKLTTKQITDIGKVVLGGLAGGAAVNAASNAFKQNIKINATPTGDIYKDAPLAGFRMVKMQDAAGQTKYVPFIKDKAQLPTAGFTKVEGYAKGGFVTRR